MYCQHFSLKKKPFQINPDNEFLWLGKKHSTALELLKKGVVDQQGLLVLTGDIGTGKTTLINEILHTRDKNTLFVKIVDPCLEQYHLFLTIAQAFGFEKEYKKGGKFSLNFFSFLKTAENRSQKVLVIVDEAQRAPDRFLKEIISWAEFNLNNVLTVILAGQLEFKDVLESNLGLTGKDHITVHAFLEPLNKEETQTYINKRLELAGANQNFFLSPAVHEIYEYSKGTPRLINISCDQGLIAAFAKGMKVVDAPTIKQELSQLHLPVIVSKTRKKIKKKLRVKSHQTPDRHGSGKKKALWVAAVVCICIYIGYSFYPQIPPLPITQPKVSDPPPKHPPLKIQSPPPIPLVVSEPDIQLKKSKKNLIVTPHPIIIDIQTPTEPNSIVEEMPATPTEMHISLSEKPVPTSEEPVQYIEEPDPPLEDKGAPQPALVDDTEKEKSIAASDISPRSKGIKESPIPDIEPEPDAIIDWLFEKNRRTKKE